MPRFINYNGQLLDEAQPIVTAGSRGLRYGDGVFETMKGANGKILLESLHFERLFQSLNLLQFDIPVHFTATYLREQIFDTCTKNQLKQLIRIRLNVFRKNGGLYETIDHTPEFVIETWELPESIPGFNENGLVVDLYKKARKPSDAFSNIKSNNYLTSVMAARFAKDNNLSDALILNSYERVCDASIANVFWVEDATIFTPPLSEGPVAGVMRGHLLQILPNHGFMVQESPLIISRMHHADEVFLTNAIAGIRWVKQFQNKQYTNTLSAKINFLLR